MSKPALLAVSLAAALLAASRLASADTPPWCQALTSSDRPTGGNLDSALHSADVRSALYDLVGVSCHPDGRQAAHAGELAAARARWSEALGMTPADWADVVDWARQETSTRGTTELHAKANVAWSKLGSVDQYAAISFAFYNDQDGTYMTDALGSSHKLTEAGRLAYITGCLHDKRPAAWAMCAPDVAAFDPAKLSAELAQDTAQPAWRRMTVRLIAYDLQGALAKHAAAVRAAIDSDPAYAKMFELAARVHADWDARASDDASLRDLALAMDDARITKSRHALEGCGATTMAAWRIAVGAIPAASFSGLQQIELSGDRNARASEVLAPLTDQALTIVATTPEGYLASLAVATCDATALPLGHVLERWPGLRGPRTAALTAMMMSGFELDREDQKIAWPLADRTWFAAASKDSGSRGVILSVIAHGNDARVEFAHKPSTYQVCDASHETGRVTQITFDGHLVYESVCTKWSTRTTDLRAPSVTLSSHAAAGLEAGMFADLGDDRVQVAWASPTAKVPSIIFGVPVK